MLQCASYGTEGSILLLQICLDHLHIYLKDSKNRQMHPIFASLFKHIMDKPNFGTVMCQSLSTAAINGEYLQNLSNAFWIQASKLLVVNSIIVYCLAGKNFCMSQIAELSGNYMVSDSSELIQQILVFLSHSEGLSKYVDSFMQMLSLVQLKEGAQFILAPFLSDELRDETFFRHLDLFNEGDEDNFDAILAEMEKESSMADMMNELGYGCTANVSQCKEMLSLFLPLSDVTIAKILGTIARTYAGLDDSQNVFSTFCSALGGNIGLEQPSFNSWNVDVLVDSIRQLAPEVNWVNVMEKLDHENFYIPNETAFSFFMSVYKYACQDPFPLHAICGSIWKNVEGQLSFLKYAISMPPEVFTFAHSERKMAYDDVVTGHKYQSGQLNHAWCCHDLLEVLCQLAERGHANFVRSAIKNPLNHCPETLLLGMARVNTAYNLIQNEVAAAVLPVVLKNTSGNNLVLHLWQDNPNMLLRGFIDVLNLDPDNYSRILDSCQDLKILSPVLDMIPSYFGIKLAALASRKELMDLENWLSNKLVSYKDAFYEECLKFLKEVQLGAQDVSSNRFHPIGALVNIYLEAYPSFLKVLRSHVGVISSSHLSDEMEKLHATSMRVNTRLKDDGTADSSSSDSYADDIEKEANSYFHQLFSGLLAIDAMIQMLTRFKESPERREQLIFECMIANLFEEYKFFSKYPDRQLKIAACLFGSLIRHQLVTHLTLGIALRAVLDALRKPADSKMFAFGTKALEQFVDRLIEWPQYCNHILQISHLRVTNVDLVTFIERALARISAAHTDQDIVHNDNTDLHHSSTNVETPSSSFLLPGLGSLQTGPPVAPTIQLPQRSTSSLDERKPPVALAMANYLKPAQSAAAQPAVAPSIDTASIQKASDRICNLLSCTMDIMCAFYFLIVLFELTILASPGFPRSSRTTSARFGSALNIETLVTAAERREIPIETPASEIQDKISFIINNLSAANIEAKAKEFNEILNERYYPWFAQYMVMKRASIEPNFHDLYLKFVDKVNLKSLNKEVVQATYENCKVLLGSELIKSSSEERSLLKNLGSWLGKITIGKNQVLRAREIDPKSLIVEAYEKGLMIAVIPFTSKILEPCSNSLAYQPPNPWTMGILGLLVEIYAMPNLKINLKFDIEVLFKNLGVDLKEVTPTSLLKDKIREVEGNPDFSNKEVGSSQPQVVNEVKPGIIPTINQVEQPLDVVPPHPGAHSHIISQASLCRLLHSMKHVDTILFGFLKFVYIVYYQYAAPLHTPSGTLADDEKLTSSGVTDQHSSTQGLPQGQAQFSVNQIPVPASNMEQQVIINKKLHALGLYLNFQSVLPIAMDRAITEIVSSIVQRSVSIATQTTKELVLKDYALEPDETLIRNAAHLMVARLAGSLAHVTCKEPLRGSISSQLRGLLQGLSISSELLEQAIQLVTNDNLDLGCAVIEQAATEKAIQTIDGEIAQQLTIRRKHREGAGLTYFDSSLYAQSQMGGLPDALRPKPGRLSHSQQRVYEDFARLPWQNWSTQGSNTVPVVPITSSGGGGLSRQFASASDQITTGIYSSGTANAGISAIPQNLKIGYEELDANVPHLPSVSSTHIATVDAPTPQSLENDVSSFPLASTPELHLTGPSNYLKEQVASVQSVIPTLASERLGSNILEPLITTGDALDKYQAISEKLENLVISEAKDGEIQGVIAEVPAVILRCISRDEAALAVAQKAFKGLYEKAANRAHVSAHLAILAAIRDVSKLVVKELTSWVMYSDEDRKFNKDITVGLIGSELLNLAEYNVYMAKLIDAGRNKAATEFAISLIQSLVVNDSKVISELHNLVDALAKALLAARPGSPESLQQLVEIAKNPTANPTTLPNVIVGKDDNLRSSKDKKATGLPGSSKEDYSASESVEPDPAGLHEQVSMLFAEWYRELPWSKELSVSHCLSSEVINSSSSQSHLGQPLSFLAIDIYGKLVFSILKFFPVDQGPSKLSLLLKILAVTVKFIQKDAAEKSSSFNPRPYFRLFINWLLDLCSLEPVFDGTNFQVLTALANAFHALQPLKIPGFSFAWLELVSHRSFMPKLLTVNAQKGWPYFQRLLVDLFQFMEPFLRLAELGDPIQFLYKGTLRVLLVLLHDFPEFLCDYHFSFCDVIPPSCIQMRNIILSAFPRNMRLPDPSTPNLKIDLLAEISHTPRLLSEIDAALKAKQIKNDLDEFLKSRQQGSSFLTELKQKLLLTPSEGARSGSRYNVPLMNSLVLYIGVQQLQARIPPYTQSMGNMSSFLVSAALDIFQTLILELDSEGRYLFLNAIGNQLRYPNNHTHYFSFILLYLFNESNQEIIQEQITRVLLERLIVNRPHPWGLLITFIELIKNPRYNFWSRSFTRCAPEIEKLFESVSRSCGGPKPVDDSVVSGGIPDNMH
ncbi:hypothetical protein F511_17815 [Dorcoceras hygrometricum]|uniref:CCR4-NOT transcription complex subunit 1-like n=1 Tax=Dorcoceras hygrometricum TaxID=472368 RepID=A0A2Z7AII9_9LAMI|nr:hypothetical protein F511_17815 [Dorcoceras hygrometricum]